MLQALPMASYYVPHHDRFLASEAILHHKSHFLRHYNQASLKQGKRLVRPVLNVLRFQFFPI